MSTSIETFVLRRSFWERKVSSPFNRFIISSFHSEKHSSFCFETKLKRRYWNTGTNFNCSSQPSSVHWLSTSIFPCSFDVCLSRHDDVSSFFSLFGRPNQPRHPYQPCHPSHPSQLRHPSKPCQPRQSHQPCQPCHPWHPNHPRHPRHPRQPHQSTLSTPSH